MPQSVDNAFLNFKAKAKGKATAIIIWPWGAC